MAINTVGVVGAGTMGNGIAHVFAQAGCTVRLMEVNGDALKRGDFAWRCALEDPDTGEILAEDVADFVFE